ncbi:MAG: hypothetical protein ACHQIO_11395 [Nevskiales bacterium]
MPLGAASLLFGLLAGLDRLGWGLPVPSPDIVLLHGPLMAAGFFGTLIAFERAVAMRSAWTYAAPLLTGLGGLALALGAPALGAAGAILAGSTIYLLAALRLNVRHRALHIAVMTLGAACLFAGNLLWLLGSALPGVVPWWLAFLVLTIGGERLELSRLVQPPDWARAAFLGCVLVLLAGVAVTGWRMLGIGLLGLAIWLSCYDIARRTVGGRGQARFSAICLLSGYAWLGLAGLYALLSGDPTDGLGYDAILHAVFLGFVFAMVFGHAPIILPAVAGIRVPFRRGFYAPLAVLHAGLLLRIAGDLLVWEPGRSWGGLVDALAILGFLATVAAAVLGQTRKMSRP